jgi:hypothetical protein
LVVPDTIRSYESKQTITPVTGKQGLYKKTFEYVIQGTKAGTYTITSQSFVYFDTKSRSCKMLTTQPVELLILPKPENEVSSASTMTQHNKPEQYLPGDITRMDYSGSLFKAEEESYIPRWLFLLFLSIPVVIFGGAISIRAMASLGKSSRPYFRRRTAFFIAKKQLKVLASHKMYHDVYNVFIRFFAARIGIDERDCTEDLINEWVERHANQEYYAAWKLFFYKSARMRFGHIQTEQEKEHIIKEAEQWLKKIAALV